MQTIFGTNCLASFSLQKTEKLFLNINELGLCVKMAMIRWWLFFLCTVPCQVAARALHDITAVFTLKSKTGLCRILKVNIPCLPSLRKAWFSPMPTLPPNNDEALIGQGWEWSPDTYRYTGRFVVSTQQWRRTFNFSSPLLLKLF